MKLFGDYHTHTTYTHGKSTIEENVVSAINKGLKQIAITEHSFFHMAHGITKKDYINMKAEIQFLRQKYPQIEILCGVEANLLNFNGDIDTAGINRDDFDIIVMGYHFTSKPTGFKNFFNFFLLSIFKLKSEKRKQKNTLAYIYAINKYEIDILAHLNYGIQVDPVKIAEAAAKREVYIELNGKRINFTDNEMLDMVKTGVKFIINSDAHKAGNVGKNNMAFALIERLNIPHEQIVNLNYIPKLKRFNLNEKY